MPSHLPYLGPAGISRIISEVETNALRNIATKFQRLERSQVLDELSRMAPADLERINAAVSRLERQQNLTDARVTLAQLRFNVAQQNRDLRELRRYFGG